MSFSNVLKKTLCVTQVGGLFFSYQGLGVFAKKFDGAVLKKNVKDLSLTFEKIQALKKLVEAGILNGNYCMAGNCSSETESEKSNGQNFSDLLMSLERFLYSCFSALKELGCELDKDEFSAACKKDSTLKEENFCLGKIEAASKIDFDDKDFKNIKGMLLPVSTKIQKQYSVISRVNDIFESVVGSVKNCSFNSIKVDEVMKKISEVDSSYAKVEDMAKGGLEILDNSASSYSKVVNFLKAVSGEGEEENKDSFSFFGDESPIKDDKQKERVLRDFLRLFERERKAKLVKNKIAKMKKAKEAEESKKIILEEIKSRLFNSGKKVLLINFLANVGIFNKEYSMGTTLPLEKKAKCVESNSLFEKKDKCEKSNLLLEGKNEREGSNFGKFFEFLNEIFLDALLQYFSCYGSESLGNIKIENEENLKPVDFLERVKSLSGAINEIFRIFSMVLFFTPDIVISDIKRDISTNIISELLSLGNLYNTPASKENMLTGIRKKFKVHKGNFKYDELFNNLTKLGEVPSYLKGVDVPIFRDSFEKSEYFKNLLQEVGHIFFIENFGVKFNEKSAIFINCMKAFFDLYSKSCAVKSWEMIISIKKFIKKNSGFFKYGEGGKLSDGGEVVIRGKEKCAEFRDISLFNELNVDSWKKVREIRGESGLIAYAMDRYIFNRILIRSVSAAIDDYLKDSDLKENFERFKEITYINNTNDLYSNNYVLYEDSFYKKFKKILDEIKERFNLDNKLSLFLKFSKEKRTDYTLTPLSNAYHTLENNLVRYCQS